MVVSPFWVETGQAGRIALLPRPRGGEWLDDEIDAWRRAGVDVVVSLLTPEEEADLDLADEARVSHRHGLQFVSFPVPDRGVPDSRVATAELAASLTDAIAAGKNVGFHCRQGIGRSAMLAACVLAAVDVDPDTALARIAAARGLPVPETVEQRRWVSDFARLRLTTRR
jgi:protein-tyrosine phosphatase